MLLMLLFQPLVRSHCRKERRDPAPDWRRSETLVVHPLITHFGQASNAKLPEKYETGNI